MTKQEPIELEGRVTEILPNRNSRVRLQNEHDVLADAATFEFHPRVLVGDKVTARLSPYNLSRGRIVCRHVTGGAVPPPASRSGEPAPSVHSTPSRTDHLRVASMEMPGCCVGVGSAPCVGESVFCVDGQAEVVRILGRTGDGSRLIELHLAHGSKAPYFAAASNVLRRSEQRAGGARANAVRDQLIGEPDRDFIGVSPT